MIPSSVRWLRSLLWAGLLLVGCYSPDIPERAFFCSESLCPDGFQCQDVLGSKRCVRPNFQLSIGDFGTGEIFFEAGSACGILSFDTESGRISFKEKNTASLPPTCDEPIDVASVEKFNPNTSAGFYRVAQSKNAQGGQIGPTLGLWNFRNFVLPDCVAVCSAPDNKSVIGLAATIGMTLSTVDVRLFGGVRGEPGKGGGDRGSGVRSAGSPPSGSAALGPGGGGAGHAEMGGVGGGATGGFAGDAFGGVSVPVHLGSGGGGGGSEPTGSGGFGGFGGGGIAIYAQSLTLNGPLDVSGQNGQAASAGRSGGGGGGSGGTIFISAGSIGAVGTNLALRATGGSGGAGIGGGADGGAGSSGRIFISSPSNDRIMSGSISIAKPEFVTRSATVEPVKGFIAGAK